MLTEHFVASISVPTKPNTGVTKDAGIFLHEYQPLAAQRHVFKKSATAPNGLAVSNSHVFAAQEGKAVVHVYSREKGNQEAIVPFPERIHSVTLAAEDTVLLLGTESGRILAWEICSGRLVSTSTSHLQPVTSLAVSPSSNFFLSGSSDAMIHVWALPSILTFSPDTSRTPVHTLSTHRGPIAALVCGHSSSTANIAVSISQDKSAIVWDYHNGRALRTYLLPENPKALALDAADRAFFVAYEDSSLQALDFYDEVQKSVPIDTLRDASSSHRPIQPSQKTRLSAESQKLGGALSLSLSWDGTTLISGHDSGKLATWDVAKSNYLSTLANLPGPVTNISFLPPTGFPNTPESKLKIHTIVKPKQDVGGSGSGLVPQNYSLNVQFTGRMRIPPISATETGRVEKSDFEEALTHPSFPAAMLEESLIELENWSAPSKGVATPAADFLSLDHDVNSINSSMATDVQGEEIKELKKQLASLQRIQKVTFSQLSELREEKDFLMSREMKRAKRKQQKAKKKLGVTNGDPEADEDVEMSEGSQEVGSSTYESESNDSNSTESEGGGGGDGGDGSNGNSSD